MKYFLLTAAGPDKPGLVAGLTKALFELGCNLEDSAMARLKGEFAVLLMFSADEKASAPGLQKKLAAAGKRLGVVLHVKPVDAKGHREPPLPLNLCLISVYGADKPGLVYHVTHALAKAKINVTDLTTHRTSPTGPGTVPGYILLLEGERPAALALEELQKEMGDVAQSLGVTISVKSLDPTPL